MQNFKINAQLCIYSLADRKIEHCVEFTFYLSITSFLNIQVQNLLIQIVEVKPNSIKPKRFVGVY